MAQRDVKVDILKSTQLVLTPDGVRLVRPFRVDLGVEDVGQSPDKLLLALRALGVNLYDEHPSNGRISFPQIGKLTQVKNRFVVNSIEINAAPNQTKFMGNIIYGQDLQTGWEIRCSTFDEETMRDNRQRPLYVRYVAPKDKSGSWNNQQKIDNVAVARVVVKKPTFSIVLSKIIDVRDGVFGINIGGTIYRAPDQIAEQFIGRVNKDEFLFRKKGQWLITDIQVQKIGRKIFRFTTTIQHNRYGWDPVCFFQFQNGRIVGMDEDTQYKAYMKDPVGYRTTWEKVEGTEARLTAFNTLPNGFSRPETYPQIDIGQLCGEDGVDYDMTELARESLPGVTWDGKKEGGEA